MSAPQQQEIWARLAAIEDGLRSLRLKETVVSGGAEVLRFVVASTNGGTYAGNDAQPQTAVYSSLSAYGPDPTFTLTAAGHLKAPPQVDPAVITEHWYGVVEVTVSMQSGTGPYRLEVNVADKLSYMDVPAGLSQTGQRKWHFYIPTRMSSNAVNSVTVRLQDINFTDVFFTWAVTQYYWNIGALTNGRAVYPA